MIQVLGLRDWTNNNKPMKRETFFSKGWRFQQIQDVFDTDKVKALLSEVPENDRYNLYFTVADCYEEAGRKLKEQWAIPFDIDDLHINDGEHLEAAHQAAMAGAEALGVPFNEMAVVFTGNGVQFFILLDKPIVDEEYFDNTRVQYGVLAKRIQTKLTEKGIKGKVDTSVWSKARLMRLPLTFNRKPGRPERQAWVLNGTMVARHFDLYEESGVTHIETAEHVSDVVLKNYPKPDTKAITNGCDFLKWCKAKPNEVSEPQWYAMVSLTSRLDNGRELTHEYAQGYHGYNHYETENKIDQALAASGPRTCKNIDSLWDGCAGCEHYAKLTSPIMIKGADYIASKDFGFRQRKIKDDKVVPGPVVYLDLVKQFTNEHPYKVVKDSDQVVIFNGKYWEFITDRELKAWSMSMIRPEPNSAEMSEFIQQLKAFNVTSMDELHRRKDGYMNFNNCVLNVQTLETTTHSPEYGFFEVRPFAYDPRAKSPQFDQFMLDIMEGDAELVELLKEFAGYCISGDPCWLQKSLLLVGDGANGKSVFMELLGELVGKDSHSAIAMQELDKDTMRYQLVNKLFNYSEETSMRALSDSSTFKALVSGGMMTVKQLYVQPFMYANRAKLILSANNMPYSTDRTHGLWRRMVIVRFNVKFEEGDGKHDYFIKDKLRLELPGICNSLIDAYARLKKRRLLSAQAKIKEEIDRYSMESDPVLMFIESHIEAADPEEFVKVAEVFETFIQMCDMGQLKPCNVIQFGKSLTKYKGYKSEVRTKNGDRFRVYPAMRLRKVF